VKAGAKSVEEPKEVGEGIQGRHPSADPWGETSFGLIENPHFGKQ